MRYQETWIRGRATGEAHQRECASRYEPIREALSRYTRHFSVFDFGANMGYFAFRIAEEFPHATVVAVDGHTELADLARENGLPNVVVLNRRMNAGDLAQLASCEAFDVVLALNVLHHMPDWEPALEALRSLGSVAFIETPGPGDSKATGLVRHKGIREAVEKAGVEVLRTAAHKTAGAERVMYRLDNWRGRSLSSQTLDAAERGAPAMSRVTLGLDPDGAVIEIRRQKGDDETREFHPGINLWTAHLGGLAWPVDVKARITAEVERLDAEGRWHDDLRPWNFILSGDRAVAIDTANKAWRTEPEPGGLAKCLAML
jgi:SAM-dependent methyltransferase